MFPLYMKSDNVFNLDNVGIISKLFSIYFICSTFATLLNIFYAVSAIILLQKFNLINNYFIRMILGIQSTTLIYTKIIVWKLLLIFLNIKLGYVGYTIFLSSLNCDLYLNYIISRSSQYTNKYKIINQYTNNITQYIKLSFYIHNKYCIERVFSMFFYCLCDDWILLMFEHTNSNLTKILNFNFRVLDDFINTSSITFVFQYNVVIFLLQIIYLFILHNYFKKY